MKPIPTVGIRGTSGRLAESNLQFDAGAFVQARWLGVLWLLKSGRIPGRIVINETPPEVLGSICDAAGVPAADRDFDADTTEYGFILPGGYGGVRQMLSAADGEVWDDDQGRIRYESKASRDAALVVTTYVEEGPTGTQIEIAPPRSLTKPFGVVNDLTLEVHVYNQSGVQGGDQTVNVPLAYFSNGDNEIIVPLGFTASDGATLDDYALSFDAFGAAVDLAHPDTSSGWVFNGAYRLRIRNLAVTLQGGSVKVEFTADLRYSFTLVTTSDGRLGGTITVNDLMPFAADAETFTFNGCDLASIGLYGFRPRPAPLIATEESPTPADSSYVVTTDTDALIQRELARYARPIPVVAISRASEDVVRLQDILARRMGDKVHLNLNGRSRLGHDADFVVRAMDTRLAPSGELNQTLWCVRAPLPPRPGQPGDFEIAISATENVLTWTAPTDGGDLTHYKVLRANNPDDAYAIIGDNLTGLTYTDSNFMSGVIYHYIVVAVGPGGDGPNAGPVSSAPRAALDWRFDTLANFLMYFTRGVLFPGHWEHRLASSGTGNESGPSSSNVDDYMQSRPNPVQQASLAVWITSGTLPFTDDANSGFTDRIVTVRYCNRATRTSGLLIQGRDTGGEWVDVKLLATWRDQLRDAMAGDVLTDDEGVTFTVAQDGGWRDETFYTGNYAEYRGLPQWTTNQVVEQWLSLHSFAAVASGSMSLPQLSAPTGLALTTSGGDITATWNAVTDATGYVLEWREQGSGDAWQEVDVTTPPHTFTP